MLWYLQSSAAAIELLCAAFSRQCSRYSLKLLLKYCYLFLVIRRGAVAVYQFTSTSKNRDVSSFVNPPARFVGVVYSRGPDNHPRGAISLRGIRTSYVLIPNNGCLDTRYSITIIFWVYPESPGPLIHFKPNGWGVHVWIVKSFRLYARFVPRSGKSVRPLYKKIKPRQWNYVAATYDHRTGLATLWLSSLPIIQRKIGRFRLGLATNYPIVIGRKPGDRRRFRGKISCLQIYNFAMNGVQIRSKTKRCFRAGSYQYFLANTRFGYNTTKSIFLSCVYQNMSWKAGEFLQWRTPKFLCVVTNFRIERRNIFVVVIFFALRPCPSTHSTIHTSPTWHQRIYMLARPR